MPDRISERRTADPNESVLTLAEAVPLASVALQRQLDQAGIRSLVIKGPAFVVLGVRRWKQSNDIDLLIDVADRPAARRALTDLGWLQISFDLPDELGDVLHHSRTYRHPNLPCGLDLHHRVPGLFLDSHLAFERLWQDHVTVALAHAPVRTPSVRHSLIIEAVNGFRDTPASGWSTRARLIHESSLVAQLHLADVVSAALDLGAESTVEPLVLAMGGAPSLSQVDRLGDDWRRRAGHQWRPDPLLMMARRAPTRVPAYLWQQIWIPEWQARRWAEVKGVPYGGRLQVAAARSVRLFRGLVRRAADRLRGRV